MLFMAAFLMGSNLHLFFLFRMLGEYLSSDCAVLAVTAGTPKTFFGSRHWEWGLPRLSPLLGLGEDCYLKERLEECWEARMAPCVKCSSFGVRIEAGFTFPAGIFRFLFADWYFIKMLRIVAGPMMSSGKDFVFLCPLALSLSFLLYLHYR